jgi:hypothetical protein
MIGVFLKAGGFSQPQLYRHFNLYENHKESTIFIK